MQYEHFLFTRIKQRDFTAFVRPAEMTNKEVSTIARAFNYINDVTVLMREHPALYCFPLGRYTLLLRHYDSGRKHAGREVGVIEGIAVLPDAWHDLMANMPHFITHHDELLNVSGTVEDIEAIDVYTSPQHEWKIHEAQSRKDAEENPERIHSEDGLESSNTDRHAEDVLREFVERRDTDQWMLPFTEEGRVLLVQAASSAPLYFAFGTNTEVTTELKAEWDVVSFFSTLQPGFRPRPTVVKPAPTVPVSQPVAAPTVRTIAAESEAPPTQPRRPRERRGLLTTLMELLLGRR